MSFMFLNFYIQHKVNTYLHIFIYKMLVSLSYNARSTVWFHDIDSGRSRLKQLPFSPLRQCSRHDGLGDPAHRAKDFPEDRMELMHRTKGADGVGNPAQRAKGYPQNRM